MKGEASFLSGRTREMAKGRAKGMWIVPPLLLMLLLSLSLAWNLSVVEDTFLFLAADRAKTFFKQIAVARLWNAGHGGVYVPVTEGMAPNPYLEDSHRDVIARSGMRLTKINPAYMTRQISELARAKGDVLFHITSLKPIRPENRAEDWEAEALRGFERGKKEHFEFNDAGSVPVYRYMAPLMTERECLRCHAKQGYRIGDIRGGISVTIPAQVIIGTRNAQRRNIIFLHAGVLLLGMCCSLAFQSHLRRQWKALEESEKQLQKAKDDLEVKVWERTSALRDANEKLQREIVEHRKAEETTMRAKEFNDTVLDSMKDAIFIIDRSDFRIIGANRVFLGELGMQASEVIGRTCYEITRRRSAPCPSDAPCPCCDTVQTGTYTVYEHLQYRKDGSRMHVEVSASPITNEKGEITHIIHVARDMTERRHLEEQLRHAQKMEAVGHLAGGIAHDFNNILTAILGYGNLLRMQLREGDPLVHSVDHILASAERAAGVTQSLLAFSRKQVINPRPVGIVSVVRNLEKLLVRLIGEDIELETEHAEPEMTVMADRVQMEQVLMNLATNARDAMPRGGRLSIDTMRVPTGKCGDLIGEEAAGDYALIALTDTGTGMDAVTREKIFEPFFTTKEVGKGTGLGLSIVYGIIKQHGGFIRVHSEPGAGTTFALYLPLLPHDAAGEAARQESSPPRGGNETILIAEDEIQVRQLLRDILETYGYRILEAADGEEAVRLCKENGGKVDLVLLDVIMPKKNGKEAYEEIAGKGKKPRALFMSGYPADMIRSKGIHGIEECFLSKPVHPAELLGKVREALDRGQCTTHPEP